MNQFTIILSLSIISTSAGYWLLFMSKYFEMVLYPAHVIAAAEVIGSIIQSHSHARVIATYVINFFFLLPLLHGLASMYGLGAGCMFKIPLALRARFVTKIKRFPVQALIGAIIYILSQSPWSPAFWVSVIFSIKTATEVLSIKLPVPVKAVFSVIKDLTSLFQPLF
jgi:hypothetical protein